MKKIFAVVMLLLAIGSASQLKAQNCDEAITDYYMGDASVAPSLHPSKYFYICALAQAALFFPENGEALPEDAIVLDITTLQNSLTQEYVPANFIPDSTNCNYFKFTFRQAQAKNSLDKDIYFRLHAGEHQYLGLRSHAFIVSEAERRETEMRLAGEF